MTIHEKCRKAYHGEYKTGFMKYLEMDIAVFSSYISCTGLSMYNGILSNETLNLQLEIDQITEVNIIDYHKDKCIEIKYNNRFGDNSAIYFIGIAAAEECKAEIEKAKEKRKLYIEQQKQLKKDKETNAKNFYDKCLNYHIKNNTPKYELIKEKNRIVLIYFDNDKNMVFLEINGYTQEEIVGEIPYQKIHYYEKAGNVHYLSEIKGNYSGFGGSFTGADFSKTATAIGGLLFGVAGMAAGAMLTHKKMNYRPAETELRLDSEVKRIDERNVILNYYSDKKRQYLDIELPQDIYNFLLAYIPNKRFDIVNEIEKNNALHNNSVTQQITAKQTEKLTEHKMTLSMNEFREKVEKIKMMKETGLLTEEEFAEEKKKLLAMV